LRKLPAINPLKEENKMIRNEMEKADPLHTKMREIDLHVSSCVYAHRNGGLLRKLFPDRRERERVEHELRLSKTEFEFREAAHRIANNAKIQAFKEKCNDSLKRGKAEISVNRAEFLLKENRELENLINGASAEFVNQLMKLEADSIEQSKGIMIEDRDESVERFRSMIRRLRDDFDRSMDAEVCA
jgi:hypothetical protein